MRLLIWTLTLLAATSGAAHAGPVAGFVAAVSGWFATTFGAAVGGFLFNTISSLALSALSMAIRGKPEVRQPGITTDTTTAGGTIPQRLIFGRYATAGQMVAPMMVYQTDGNPNEWLVYVISLADKPVTGLGRLFIDGRPQTIDGSPAASAHADTMGATMLGDGDGDDSLRDKAFIRFHDGRQTTADAYLRRVFGTYPERPWTADMIGAGVAYAVVTFKGKSQDGDYSGFPSVKFELDGHALYDPRDATQSAANETTWKFTRNPAIIAYNILRGISIPGGSTWGVGARRFVQSYVIAAANICDQVISAPGGGTRIRYQAGLEVSVADEPHQALTEITKAMAGEVADMGGTWLLSAGDPGGSVLSITDDDIIVTDSRNLRPYPGLDETVNAIHASYPDPAQQWEAKEAVPLYNAAYEAADGGRRLVSEVDFPAVPYPVQVRALMREMLADHRRMRTHVITLPPDALGLLLGDHIAWTSPVNGYIGKLFKVVAKRVDPQSLCVALTITERDPSDYDYDAESDGDLPTLPSPRPVIPTIVGVPGFAVTAVVIPGDTGSRPGIVITWDPEVDAQGVFWEVQRFAGAIPVASGTERPRAGRKEITEGLIRATAYAVRGLLVIPGRITEPTPWFYVTTENIRLGWEDLQDEVLTDVTQLETWINDTGTLIRQVMDEVGLVRDDMVEGDADAFNARQQIRADLDLVALDNSTALDALVVRITDTEAGIVAQSDAITAVEAKTDRGTASGLLRISAESAPTGVQTRIGLRAEASAGEATHSAAMYLEANSDGTSNGGFVANRFFVVNGTGPTAARTAPFVVDDGIVYMGTAMVRTLSIGPNQVTVPAAQTLGSALTGNNGWQEANRISITLEQPGFAILTWFASHGYTSLPSSAGVGIRLRQIGTGIVWERQTGNPAGTGGLLTDWLSMGWNRSLPAGTTTFAVEWFGELSVMVLGTRTFIGQASMR